MKIIVSIVLCTAAIINTAEQKTARRESEPRCLTVGKMMASEKLNFCSQKSPAEQLKDHLIKTGRLSQNDSFTVTEPRCFMPGTYTYLELDECEACHRGASMCVCMSAISSQLCMPEVAPFSYALTSLLGSLCLLPTVRACRLLRLEVKRTA